MKRSLSLESVCKVIELGRVVHVAAPVEVVVEVPEGEVDLLTDVEDMTKVDEVGDAPVLGRHWEYQGLE